MLRLDDVHAHYGSAHVLHGVSLEVAAGSIVCLLGRNGVGKSTTLKAIMGVVRPSGGTIRLHEAPIGGLAAHAIAARGIAWVPEDRRVFASLTVEENIRVAGQATPRADASDIAQALAFFPDLVSRRRQRAGSLSGGQQQMVAIARALASRPELILLDEPSEGLSPMMVKAIRDGIVALRGRGVAVLLVEQNLGLALGVGDFFYVLSRGAVVASGSRAALEARPELIREHLGVHAARAPRPPRAA